MGIHELGTGKTQGVVNQAKVGSKIALLCGYVGTVTVIDHALVLLRQWVLGTGCMPSVKFARKEEGNVALDLDRHAPP